MRPTHLTIEGLRSFRSPARREAGADPRPPTIDFTDRTHVAIIGDTGAGKSSILEAITYALYGQTTFTAHANQELMNDTSTDLRVVLRFRVSGETWEVARSLRRGGQGGVGQARAQLRRLDGGGEAVEQVEQVKRVNERIVALLGLDSAAFLRTVVLPQGRFARLLVEDEPRDRSRILRQVWRTDELEAAGGLAGRARQQAAELRIRLEQASSEYPDDPTAHRERLQAALAAAAAGAATATRDQQVAERALDSMQDAEKMERAASGVIERLELEAVKTDRAADRLAPIAALDRALGGEEATLRRQQAELEEALAHIPTDDGPSGEEVAAALTTLERLPALAKSCEEAAATLRAGTGDAGAKHAEAKRLAGLAAAARTEAEDHAVKRPPLDEAVRAAQELRATVERKHSRCVERAAAADEARKRHETVRAETDDCGKRLATARKTERTAARATRTAEEHLAAARRAGSAAAAAHDLHAGDTCPICQRELPAEWEAPDATGLAEAVEVHAAADAAAREAARAATALDAERKGLARQAVDAEAGAATAAAALQEARRELARDIRADLDAEAALPDRDALLVPLAAACSEAAERLAGHDRIAEALRSGAAERETAAGVAREAAVSADRLAAQSQRIAAQAVESLAAAVGSIPPPYRPRLSLPEDAAELRRVDILPVRKQTKAAQERADALAERAAERARLERRRNDAAAALAGIARRRAKEVDAPLDALVGDLNAHRDVLVDAANRLEVDAGVPAAVAARDAGALESCIGAIRSATEKMARAASHRALEAVDLADTARVRLTAIGDRLDAHLDEDNPDAIVDRARAAADDARFAERRAREEAERFSVLVDDVLRLRSLLAEVQEKERALGDLEDALKPGAFLKWLTLRRSRRLLVHASRMLEEMTAGRYSFVDPGETEEQWRVLDRDSNQPRTPASLSGGEQFIASLALALGMVEMMARSGGRLESLFLDEGFGSLDRHNLDAAVQALGAVAARGRMVAVISHVRAVAEQIDHVLAVTRGPAGSRAEWLTRRQRQRLSESETGPEAASALAGMLE